MSISNLFKPGGLVWRPDANQINAPDGTLLRADNMVPDEDGALSVRRGSRELYQFPDGTEDVHSLMTYEGSSGYTYRMMGADDQLYTNPQPGNHTAHWEVRIGEAAGFTMLLSFNYTGGSWMKDYASTLNVGPVSYTAPWEFDNGYVTTLNPLGLEPVNYNYDFDGEGDIAMGEDHQQSFFGRGTSHKKFDGKDFLNWGIAKPSAAPTLSAISASTAAIMSCATGEADGIVSAYPIVPGAVVGYWPNTIGSADGTTVIAQAAYTTDKAGSANQAIRIVPGRAYGATFGVLYKYYTADLTTFVGAKDLSGSDDDIFSVDVYIEDPSNCLNVGMMFTVGPEGSYFYYTFNPSQGIQTVVRDPKADGADAYTAKVATILDPIEPKDKPRVNTPENVKSIINSVGDGSVPSSEPVQAPVGPDGNWTRLSVSRKQFIGVNLNGRSWDTVVWSRLLFQNKLGQVGAIRFSDFTLNNTDTGTLTGDYTCVYRWVRETDRYYETSPPSDESAVLTTSANQIRVTISGTAQNAADDQATSVWVYIFGGFLDTYYRCAVATADPQLSTSLVIDLTTNEVAILTENERLEPYVDTPRDNLVAIAGPWNGRLFTLTNEGYVYPSLQTSPSTFNTYQVIDLSNQGDPLWMVKTSSGIHCGCERDVVFLAGTGDEDADRVVIDLYPHPLNIGTPPVDRAQFVDGNSILYRSTDGLIMLASQGLSHVPDDGMRLLWRGQDRHGVSALNVLGGRFRLTVDNKIIYCLAAEGSTAEEGSQVVYRLDLGSGKWSRLLYPDPLLSLYNDPDGTLIAGTNNGKLLEFEYGTGDESENPTVTILTPYMDGGNPLVRKDPFDIQFHTDTNANTATVNVYKDGSATSAATYTFSTSQPQAYRIQSDDIGTFIRGQLKVTGTFDEFQLSSLDMTYRVRPQHMNFLDTGYLSAEEPGDLVWIQEIEIDANSPSDLEVLIYLDDVLFATESVTVTPNVRTVYRVPAPRSCKSRRPRIVVKTQAADGAGEVGFDPYAIRVRTRNSGNASGNRYRTVWPAGQAP